MASLEFTRRYAMAHRLLATKSPKCAIPHGHNEFVTVRLDPHTKFAFSDTNSVAPFERVKQRWHSWIDEHVDHTLHLAESDPLIAFFREHEPQRLTQIMTFPGDPTTEALAACFFLKCSAFIRHQKLPFVVSEVQIEETPTNTVIIDRNNFDAAESGLRGNAWPWRADESINDF
jgi:6-pyruvoyltetrahydropterin/6-carboxytetrahydropterin synthase